MKRTLALILAIFVTLIFVSGCTNSDSKIATETATPVITIAPTPVPTEEQYVVTMPLLLIGDDIYSTKITVDAKDSGSNSLIVTVKFDSSNQMGATGSGMDLLTTIFAYNYDDVSPSFNPLTKEDIISAGIPYKTVRATVYPNNILSKGVDLPTDSTQGSLSLEKSYNYGAIITKEDERN